MRGMRLRGSVRMSKMSRFQYDEIIELRPSMFGKRSKTKELPPPPIAKSNSNAVEVLRAWAAPGAPQHVTLHTTWKDPGAWGLMLVDIANHAANAYAKEGHNRDEVLGRIRELWDAEWSSSTDNPKDITS